MDSDFPDVAPDWNPGKLILTAEKAADGTAVPLPVDRANATVLSVSCTPWYGSSDQYASAPNWSPQPPRGSQSRQPARQFRQHLLQPVQRPDIALRRGTLLDAQYLCCFGVGQLLEVPQRQRFAVRGIHLRQRFGRARDCRST
jgi:hypothetical protein